MTLPDNWPEILAWTVFILVLLACVPMILVGLIYLVVGCAVLALTAVVLYYVGPYIFYAMILFFGALIAGAAWFFWSVLLALGEGALMILALFV